ncbi:NAD(P)H-hydrate dehydratase [Bacillus spizizenii ATCC 6633 = JCM 2499]|uniref:ADP-dependent (S)-NAD(P)H-hydrate dehydratase n=2 Tax=Bacillus spizizenii TaxID=96241 RepID=A0A9Q4DM19_BACSC|nr:NAD(P)H-hydrate dehydratase [Bacillus spizizenii]KFI02442.1 carbohydrate kinase [Bacillus sp. BSC154]MDU7575044.1 NAD(P)H-hydrate dehydratase [Bacillus subtilis]ADM39874.1 putative carbohydrate kinase [Bacillus spizizenii str. W23]AJW85317.1 carbohydrate kinase [Bacillus spizizenii]EFG93689.1 putative carbohydrate kinase [Bacillus spizizenii ATCC 6633 = JCM 2499]
MNIPIWTEEHVRTSLSEREAESHKGTYGTALLLAGSGDMPGAALLAGLGAMRSGLGKLVIGTSESVIPLIVPVLPEATYWRDGWQKAADAQLEETYRAIAIGPGLPQTESVQQAVDHVLAADCPVILDAGALAKRTYPKREAPVILTPHPGEFSRMTGVPVNELQNKRAEYAKEWAAQLQAVIVLKGNQTVIAFPDGDCWRNPTGNGALAKGGTGDTLTGMILGMLCCHKNPKHAILNAVYLHGACAELWTDKHSAHTLLAHELSDVLPRVWKRFE